MDTMTLAQDHGADSDRLMTVSEFCVLANVSRTTFYRRRDQGQMPPLTYIGKSPRIRVSDYREWIAALPRSF